MGVFQPMQRFTKKMKDKKEISHHEHGINRELDQKCAQRSAGFLFHLSTSSRRIRLKVVCDHGKKQIPLRTAIFPRTVLFVQLGTNMADAANKYPENAPGKFYVDEQCIDCDLCRETAPANFKRNDDGGHSYVYKQPENPEEEALCKEAMEGCPVEAIGNDGA